MLCVILALPAVVPVKSAPSTTPGRQVLDADADWRFMLADPAGAEASAFDDASWRTVELPHDWSIEGRADKSNPTGSGGGFFPAGVGWYRKTFTAPAEWKGKRVSVEFDGVYRSSTVYLNGRKLGTRPSGYSSFAYDLTPHLAPSARNVLAVRVDNSAQPNSRWYSGSGIYRHVRVVVTEPTRVARWGVFVTTPEVSSERAKVSVRTRIANDEPAQATVTVRTTLLRVDGSRVGEARADVTAAPGAETEVAQEISVIRPALWSPRAPVRYRAVTEVVRSGKVIDSVETPFGIRSIEWSSEGGLKLNGQPIELVGGSVHHDNGPLGAAAFDHAEERRVEILKAAGFNAVRTAHNAPSPAFLDACDRFGLLVLDEPFDVWKTPKAKFDFAADFDEWWRSDVDALVLRDRNHPSVVMWGIGNEIQEVWTPDGAPLAKMLTEYVRKLDPTRPVAQAYPGATFGPNPDAAIAAVDVAGYNYNLAQNHAKDHERVPGRVMMTTESLPADAFEQWALVTDKPYVVGEFVWTAMDYLGESGIGAWLYVTPEEAAQYDQVRGFIKPAMATMGQDGKNPFPVADGKPPDPAGAQFMKVLFAGYPWHAADCGDIDLTGFRKPQSYYRDIMWNGGDRVFTTVRVPAPEGKRAVATLWGVLPTVASWTWPGMESRPMEVEVYSSTERVRLYLDDKLVGESATGRDQQFKAVFTVPYVPGTLKAVGLRGGRPVAESALTSAGAPARLRLTAERIELRANGQDLSFVVVEALDDRGRLQPSSDAMVEVSIAGSATIAAVGNGDPKCEEPYSGRRVKLFGGRALVVVRATRSAGPVTLTARSSDLGTATAALRVAPTAPRPVLR